MKTTWIIAPRVHDNVVQQLLHNRGVADDDVAEFLSPNWETGTHAPSLFTAMPRAVARVFDALDRGEKIVIHGDYDADGVCGSSLLFEALREIGEKFSHSGGDIFSVIPSAARDLIDEVPRRRTPRDDSEEYPSLQLSVFLPDREKDGYGVAMHTIERIAAEGAKLLITVDCGIANADQLDRAHELGVDVVVCDHHQLGDRLPAHAALLHPLAPGEVYPNKTLCGTGVAFKLASALIDEARRRGADFPVGHEKWYLDLVAIATVTDVMPLVGENRVLEHFGLKVLHKTRRPGLLALLAASGTNAADVDTETIGFRIGPRLNAAGRLASAEFAFKTVTARFPAEAAEAAATLEGLNTERQKVFAKAYAEAKQLLRGSAGQELGGLVSEADPLTSRPADPLLAVWKHDWAPGIVGLIAGRLVSDFGVPAFAFARVGDHWVGSGRSVGGLHLVEAMASCGDIFLRRGGHPQACGLSIASEELLGTFRDRMSVFSSTHFGGVQPVPTVAVDMELPLADASFALVDALRACAPFGEGNRAPVFVARNVEVIAADTMGKTGSHLRMNVYDSNRAQRKVIGFGFGDMASTLNMGDTVDVVYALEVNEWKGKKELQFRILDICHSRECGNPESLTDGSPPARGWQTL